MYFMKIICIIAFTAGSVIPSEHKDKHVIDKELSDEPHVKDGEHNPDYDHEAMLGEDDAKSFDQLSPEESKQKFEIIIGKIDKDGDGFVSQHELRDWIQYVQKRYVIQDTDRQWKEFETNDIIKDNKLNWEDYRKRTYGFMDEPDHAADREQYEHMVVRDENRWKKADSDGDKLLTKEEYMAFMHPEDSPHMKDIVVQETMEDIDKNKDGFITLEEYIGDMWPNDGKEEEPDWVKSEKEQFTKFRDLNGDGKMDFEETKKWVLPEDYDHSESEMRHLFKEADVDHDDKLSKQEMLDKHDVFVGSQATDYGEALNKHEEF